MIFSRVLLLFALPFLAVATVITTRGGEPSTDSVCCESTGTVSTPICTASTASVLAADDGFLQTSDPAISKALSLIGVNVQDIDVLVGLTCSPITVIGVGSGDTCSGTTVSCDNNEFVSYPLECFGGILGRLLTSARIASGRCYRLCPRHCLSRQAISRGSELDREPTKGFSGICTPIDERC